MWNADYAYDDVEYAVFDDIIGGFEQMRSYKAWFGAQETFDVSDKYRHKKRLQWGNLVSGYPITVRTRVETWITNGGKKTSSQYI